jgi:hypothetical protein
MYELTSIAYIAGSQVQTARTCKPDIKSDKASNNVLVVVVIVMRIL